MNDLCNLVTCRFALVRVWIPMSIPFHSHLGDGMTGHFEYRLRAGTKKTGYQDIVIETNMATKLAMNWPQSENATFLGKFRMDSILKMLG